MVYYPFYEFQEPLKQSVKFANSQCNSVRRSSHWYRIPRNLCESSIQAKRAFLEVEATDGPLTNYQKHTLLYNTLLCSRTNCKRINIHKSEADMWLQVSSLRYPCEYLNLAIRDPRLSLTRRVNLKQVWSPPSSSGQEIHCYAFH